MTWVVTLRLDDGTQARFDALRTKYFPPERNLIGAHLTLFHTLPEESWVREELGSVCGGMRRFGVEVDGLRSLGKGVAYTVRSGELMRLHGGLAAAFAAELSAQDKQRFQPHVVVQNKVTAEAARALLILLRAGFVPSAGEGVGVDLWRYLGGPWEHRETFRFGGG